MSDQLRAVWERLAQLANQQAQEVFRFSVDPERFTAHEVVIAWHATNTLVSQAMNDLAFATETLRGQHHGIIAALKAAAGNRENQN